METTKKRDTLVFRRMTPKKSRSRFLQLNMSNPLIRFASALGVFLLLVLILGIKLSPRNVALESSDVGSIASHDYKATRDFIYSRVDHEATERFRSEREREVLPVYTWNTDIHDNALERVSRTFDDMRKWIESQTAIETLSRFCEEDGSEGNASDIYTKANQAISHTLGEYSVYGKTGQINRARAKDGLASIKTSGSKTSIDRIMHQKIVERKTDFEVGLGVSLSDSTYEWLMSQHFSEEIERQIVQILDVTLSRKMIAERSELMNLKAITVQRVHDGEVAELMNDSEMSTITDLESSKALAVQMIRSGLGRNVGGLSNSLVQYLEPTLVYDEAATQEARKIARSQVADLIVQQRIQRGQTIVSSGHQIEQEHVDIYESMSQTRSEAKNEWARWLGLSVVVILMMSILFSPLRNEREGRRHQYRNLVYYIFNILVYILGLRVWAALALTVEDAWNLEYPLLLLFPFASGAMVMRLVVTRQSAFLFTIAALVMSALIVDSSEILLPYALICMLSGIFLLERPKSRSLIFRRGFVSGLLGALMTVSLYLIFAQNDSGTTILMAGVLSLISGLISAAVVTIALPIAEGLFGYATSVRLLELSNLDHPALKELFLEAPGTYQHSMMVGSLNEAAAEAIGANAILARVGGYYHDIGKVKNAQYFAENQRGDNPHDRLKPSMSALILKTHEKDGVEIAKKYKLPQDIIEFIGSHHGTGLIEFFYKRAQDMQPNVREEDYRYPGPRPQSRETGICMISDMVEAAVRSMPDKSPDRIRFLVHKLINHKFADGQFDECDLTLRDLNDIAEADIRIMNAIYHHRPQYPDQNRAKLPKPENEKSRVDTEKCDPRTRESQTMKAVSLKTAEFKSVSDGREENKKSEMKPKSDKVSESPSKSEMKPKSDKASEPPSKSEMKPKADKVSESPSKSEMKPKSDKPSEPPSKSEKESKNRSKNKPSETESVEKEKPVDESASDKSSSKDLQASPTPENAPKVDSMPAETKGKAGKAENEATRLHRDSVTDLTGALGPQPDETEEIWEEAIEDLLQDVSVASLPEIQTVKDESKSNVDIAEKDEESSEPERDSAEIYQSGTFSRTPDPHDYNFVPNLDVFKFRD